MVFVNDHIYFRICTRSRNPRVTDPVPDLDPSKVTEPCGSSSGSTTLLKSIKHIFSFQGNSTRLREMVLSIPQHISNVHVFPQNTLYKQCAHPELPAERTKPWLRPGSLSMRKLCGAIRGRNDSRLNDLAMMTEFQHTSINESINSLHNVYLSKSVAFGHPQAYVRACLTAIDHNCNVGRQPITDIDGDERYNVVSTRDGTLYTAKTIMEAKNTAWRQDIMSQVVQVNYKFIKAFLLLKYLTNVKKTLI
jgi:hypothetical protein